MIALKPTRLKDFSSLMQLTVQDDQKDWFIPFEQAYQQRSPSDTFVTIYYNYVTAGFLIIDKGFFQHAPFAMRHELGLSYIMIDRRFQRQGIGKAALTKLLTYAYAIDTESTSLCVSVPVRNSSACRFFTAAGFDSTEKTILGNTGKENIMRHELA
ncbi:GNAT family N-acetyltransferase [Vibrio sp. CAU 1672]|uniref:GNAT family N-acetyltransferase n=1 Tax=Vibrio sp. CAU 1672 TaxID=3032594 RepID=UPI0023DA0CE9|nr:GNAT family N-acetyltransferase [Vibrio sp. CAU 1672]MDF2154327.1 GNAT family N-acetyltransferase [Vibrio sp. CAU 1672]